jgi:ABC-type phosphate transport system substrate-binding protein
MEPSRRRPPRLFVRVAFYAAVVAVVFLIRGQSAQRGLGFRLPTESDTVKTITLVGLELAPGLIPLLVQGYHREFPDLHVLTRDGGTVRALEALANRQAAVGLLYRPPTRAEQALVKSAVNDTVVYYPIALGGIALLGNPSSSLDALTMDDLRRFLRGEGDARFDRLYAPDPNQGLWDAFRSGLGVALDEPSPATTTFLVDEAAVLQAVAADPRSVGIGSTLTLPDSAEIHEVRILAVRPDAAAVAVKPGYEQVGYGEYPLYHYLYVGCLKDGSVRGAMFVTFLNGDRGQRQVERAGFLPARQTWRPISLTRHPLGSSN